MAATVQISQSNGAAETVTDGVSVLNFGGSDVPNLVPANSPVFRYGAGAQTWSYEIFWRFHVVNLAGSNVIQNLSCWKSSGAIEANCAIYSNLKSDGTGLYQINYSQPKRVSKSALLTPMSSGTYVPYAAPSVNNISIDSLGASNTFGVGVGSFTAPGYSQYTGMVYLSGSATTTLGAQAQLVFSLHYEES